MAGRLRAAPRCQHIPVAAASPARATAARIDHVAGREQERAHLEEEACLFYVAATRARDHLILSHAARYTARRRGFIRRASSRR